MDFERAIKYALEGKALLFYGAGFSKLATNLNGKIMGDATEFSHNLCKKMGTKLNDDLSKVSDLFLRSEQPRELISLLANEFTCKNLDTNNKGENTGIYETIASIDWMEIYTTNYDDVLEVAYAKSGSKLTAVTLHDDPKDFRNRKIVLHINGFINQLTPEKLKSEFKLTTASYNTEDFIKSRWKGAFLHGLKSARAVFFVGTSLEYDLDINRIIHSNPNLKNKSFFIDRDLKPEEIDPFDNRDLYGEVKYIGLEKFALEINKVKDTYVLNEEEMEYDSFLTISNKASEYKATKYQDVWDLLVYGTLDDKLVVANSDNNEYLLDRVIDSQVDLFLKSKQGNILIVHSDIGNGKSTYLDKLSARLRNEYEIFKFTKYSKSFDEEIHYIGNNVNNPVIIIENYYDHWNVINSLSNYIGTSLKIILTGRSFIHENRIKELLSRLDIDRNGIIECSLNKLEEKEIINLIALMDKVDMWEGKNVKSITEKKKYIKSELNSKLYNVLLEILNSKNIKNKIEDVYAEIELDEDMRKILACICINSILDIGMNVYDIIEYLEINEFNYLLRINENIRTLINWEENKIEFKSSVLAKYIMQEKMKKSEILKTIRQVAIYANKYQNDDISELISRKLISVSNLQMLLGENNKDKDEKYQILGMFDELREFELYRDRPFFWLQYAISSMECKEYERAEHYLDISLKKVSEIERNRYNGDSFDTFQIDTQRARLILEIIIAEKYNGNIASKLKESIQLFRKSSQSRLQTDSYVIKQFGLYKKIWDTHGISMTKSDKNKLIEVVKEANQIAKKSNNTIKYLDSLVEKILLSATY